MSLSVELQRLPPQALDLLRYLGTHEVGASIDIIMDDTGMSERTLRKFIRRLVTRYFVEMPEDGFYALTASGRQAAEELREYDGADPAAASAPATPVEVPPQPAPDAAPAPQAATSDVPAVSQTSEPQPALDVRRLAVVCPKELITRSAADLRIGFDRPAAAADASRPSRVVLRVSAPGCDVNPVERPLDVRTDGPAGPVRFWVMPRREGPLRIKVEVHQLVTLRELVLVGGLYFDVNVAGFPTPESGEIQVLGADVGLHTSR